MNVLLFNIPFFSLLNLSLIFIISLSSFSTPTLTLFKKKFLIEFTCVSPIPSIFSSSLYLSSLHKELNFEIDLKYFESIFAFSKPICLIPNE